MFDPGINVHPSKAPGATDLERRDLLRRSQAIDRSLGDLQVFGDLLDGEDLSLTGACGHDGGQ